MDTKKTVLSLYRKMIYSLMEVFEGDYENFHRMRITIRREIEKSENDVDEKVIRQKIIDLEEARKTISSSIIQGKLQNGEFYRYKVRKDLLLGSNTPVKDDIDIENLDENEIKNINNNINNINTADNKDNKGCCQNKNCCNVNKNPQECVSNLDVNINKDSIKNKYSV